MKPVSLEVTMMKRIGELNAEVERLKAEYTHKDGLWTQLLSENHRIREVNKMHAEAGEAARIEVARLKAEVERLTAENRFRYNQWMASLYGNYERVTRVELAVHQIQSFEAQVAQLTRAGDAMAKLLSCCGNPQSEVRGWIAAKDGDSAK